jgi:hypothetical protein
MNRKPRSNTVLVLAAAAAAALVTTAGIQQARADNPGEIELKGPVGQLSGTCPNLEFKIGQQSVSTQPGTKFDEGACADVHNDRRVEVEGLVQKDGKLTARKIELKKK